MRTSTAISTSVTMGMQCDMPSPDQATPVVYTGYGVIYNDVPLMLPSTSILVTNGSTAITSLIVPPPTNLTAGGVYGISVGGPCRVESDNSYMTCSNTPRNDSSEQ